MYVKFCQLLVLSLGLFTVSCISSKARSQNIPPIPFPDPVTPKPLQPQTPLEPLLPRDELLRIIPNAPTSPEQNPGIGTITVERFKFVGNTKAIFSTERLQKEIKEFTNTRITFTQLLQAASKITALYIKKGYVTSGAYIPEQTLTSGVVNIQIVEGSLQEIRISREQTSSRRLNDSYVRSRLKIATAKPLNVRRLQEALQLLRLDPCFRIVHDGGWCILICVTAKAKTVVRVRLTERWSSS